jgi:hypothetical protein
MDNIQWRNLVNTVMNFWWSMKCWEFFVHLNICFSKTQINATRDHNNVTGELQNTKKKTFVEPFRTKGVEC